MTEHETPPREDYPALDWERLYERSADEEDLRGYRPIAPEPAWRAFVRRVWAPVAVVLGLAVKFGAASFKFLGVFVSVAGYALIWGWRFAVGFVALILVHELGHYVEAKRQGLHPGLPVFVPFLGAYVAMKEAPNDPWRHGLLALSGPFVGGLGALASWRLGVALDEELLVALGYTAFLLNLFNLIPVSILDGGFAWRAVKDLRGDPRRTALIVLYGGLAAALAAGMYVAHLPQDRL